MKVDELAATLKRLRLFGLLARIDEVRDKPWLAEVLAIEVEEKTRRSLAHRAHLAGIGPFNVDFAPVPGNRSQQRSPLLA